MNKLISFITSPEIAEIIAISKIIFIILSLLFIIGIIFLLLKNSWLKFRFLEDFTEFFIYRPFGVKKTFKQWLKITKRLETGREADYKLALIEVDSLLDEILNKIGYKGESLGEKLKQLDPNTLPNLEQVWQAHKVRNNVVHDPDYSLTLEKAKNVMEIYEQALRDLEMF